MSVKKIGRKIITNRDIKIIFKVCKKKIVKIFETNNVKVREMI